MTGKERFIIRFNSGTWGRGPRGQTPWSPSPRPRIKSNDSMVSVLHGKRIAVVLPAYNAARTLERTVAEIPKDVVDTILLVDDFSRDETIAIARRLGLRVF